jgi:hypothetical protein
MDRQTEQIQDLINIISKHPGAKPLFAHMIDRVSQARKEAWKQNPLTAEGAQFIKSAQLYEQVVMSEIPSLVEKLVVDKEWGFWKWIKNLLK